jgi:undecaprenyl phosphate N,N'-diacetylbacillosamine 1-phosphate transferase
VWLGLLRILQPPLTESPIGHNLAATVYIAVLKRAFDFLSAAIGILIASPLLAAILVALLIQNRGKPFLFQRRPGWREQEFKVVKFRTMTDAKDAAGNMLPDSLRITWIGSFLRRYSLDELPQLFNVLKGDMSLVGPRPLLFNYIPLYSDEQRRRHAVRPGITGWAQVNGRNAISWKKKFELDVYYVDHLSLWLDLKILCVTFLKVVRSEGVNSSASRPMPPFDGTN